MISFAQFCERELGVGRFKWFYFERQYLPFLSVEDLAQCTIVDHYINGSMMTTPMCVIVFYPQTAYAEWLKDQEGWAKKARLRELDNIEDELLKALNDNDFLTAAKISKRLETIKRKIK